jgi:hypothetical protein
MGCPKNKKELSGEKLTKIVPQKVEFSCFVPDLKRETTKENDALEALFKVINELFTYNDVGGKFNITLNPEYKTVKNSSKKSAEDYKELVEISKTFNDNNPNVKDLHDKLAFIGASLEEKDDFLKENAKFLTCFKKQASVKDDDIIQDALDIYYKYMSAETKYKASLLRDAELKNFFKKLSEFVEKWLKRQVKINLYVDEKDNAGKKAARKFKEKKTKYEVKVIKYTYHNRRTIALGEKAFYNSYQQTRRFLIKSAIKNGEVKRTKRLLSNYQNKIEKNTKKEEDDKDKVSNIVNNEDICGSKNNQLANLNTMFKISYLYNQDVNFPEFLNKFMYENNTIVSSSDLRLIRSLSYGLSNVKNFNEDKIPVDSHVLAADIINKP